MAITREFLTNLECQLSDSPGNTLSITGNKQIFGGDINETFLLQSRHKSYLLKVNETLLGPDFFEREKEGLLALNSTGCIRVPRPILSGKIRHQLFLVMEYIPKGKPRPDFWEDFGRSLASLHRISCSFFGFENDNFIGRLKQYNPPHADWSSFYALERVMRLMEEAGRRQLLNTMAIKKAESICTRLSTIVPEERPSLLHGDLWSGNFLVAENGRVAVYDPAVYFGHREMDLAMTRLFGGFEEPFYAAYEEAFPLQPGFSQRLELHQLYPMLVHLLLFGGHYYASVLQILNKYA